MEKRVLLQMLNQHIGKLSTTIIQRHNKKLFNLWKTERTKSPDCIKNLSNHKLTICEENALRFGLKHHTLPLKIDHDNIKVTVEKCLTRLTPKDVILNDSLKDEIKINVNSFVKSANSICGSSVNKQFHNTLKGLRRNKSIKVINMDKGNGVVIMDSEEYFQKLDKIVLDKTKFEEVEISNDDHHPIINPCYFLTQSQKTSGMTSQPDKK